MSKWAARQQEVALTFATKEDAAKQKEKPRHIHPWVDAEEEAARAKLPCLPSDAQLVSIANRQRPKAECKWTCQAGGMYCVNPSRRFPATSFMLAGKTWEANNKAYVHSMRLGTKPLDGQIIAVAGLFFGDWLPVLSKAAGTSGRVFGFEPVATSLSAAQATTDANDLRNVVLANNCLSNTSSMISMCVHDHYGARGGGSQNLRDMYRPERCKKVAEVECVALDNALPWTGQRVGLVLLDVEGHEALALGGSMRLIKRWRPILATETPLPRDPWRALGYSLDAQPDKWDQSLWFYSVSPESAR